MQAKYNISRKLSFLSVLFSPLITLVCSLKYARSTDAKNLFWIFCISMGFIHIYFPYEPSFADLTRYAESFIYTHNNHIPLSEFMSSFFVSRGYTDIYLHLLRYIISYFTDDPRIFFVFLAAVFGFFYSRNMWLIIDLLPIKSNKLAYILIAYFFTIAPIWFMVRMWTALHVFVYGLLPFLLYKDKSKLFWCFISPLFHFSFFAPVVIFLIYIVIPKRILPLLIFYVVSFFVNLLDMEQVQYYISLLPDVFYLKVFSYTNEAYVEIVGQQQANYNLFFKLSSWIIEWCVFILLFVFSTVKKDEVLKQPLLKNLLPFSLFIFAVSHMFAFIPSGYRFLTISRMFALPLFILFFASQDSKHSRNTVVNYFCKWVLILFFIPVLQNIRAGLDYYGISLLISPVVGLFTDDNIPLIDSIKAFL